VLNPEQAKLDFLKTLEKKGRSATLTPTAAFSSSSSSSSIVVDEDSDVEEVFPTTLPPAVRKRPLSQISGELEDLLPAPSKLTVPLEIADQRQYFDSGHVSSSDGAGPFAGASSSSSASSASMHTAIHQFVGEIGNMDRTGTIQGRVGENAGEIGRVCRALCAQYGKDSQLESGEKGEGGAVVAFVQSVPVQGLTEAKTEWEASSEILRHFWSSFPITSKSLAAKVTPIVRLFLVAF
jgi:hypothetical protein